MTLRAMCAPKQHLKILLPAFLGSFLLVILGPFMFSDEVLAKRKNLSEVINQSEELTQQIHRLHSRYQQATRSEHSSIVHALRETATKRKEWLTELMQRDPQKALRLAIPSNERTGLPPDAQEDIEQMVEVEGRMQVLHVDYVNNEKSSHYLYFLQSKRKRLALNFAKKAPKFPTGETVRVKGMRLGQVMAIESGDTDVRALTQMLSKTLGAQKTAVLMINFSDSSSQPWSAAQVQDKVFSETNGFHQENSYDQTWLSGDVFGWYTIPLSKSVCDFWKLADQAQAAASSAGVKISAYDRLVYVYPKSGCGWVGAGTVGGSPSEAWINGRLTAKVFGHELGHNFGLLHSHSLDCGSTTLGARCRSNEYGDTLDMMGNKSVGHYNAFQKERLGWLDGPGVPPITTVEMGGQYIIDAYETLGSQAKALKIVKSGGIRKTWYYVEYRQAIGFDDFLSRHSNVTNGIVVHTGTPDVPNSSYLLDMTPETSSWWDPALVLGKTYVDSTAGVTLNVAWVTDTSAAVNVSFGSEGCTRARPNISLSPPTSEMVSAGTQVAYTLRITNNDDGACSKSTFTNSIAVPTGWPVPVGTNPVSIAPGATENLVLMVASPSTAKAGTYTIRADTTHGMDQNLVANATASLVISSMCSRNDPTLVVSPSHSTPVLAGSTVAYTLTVNNRDSNACDPATFHLGIEAPENWLTSFSTQELQLESGSTASTTVQVTSPSFVSDGSYRLKFEVTNVNAPTFLGSAEGTYIVGTSTLTMTVTTDQPTYKRRDRVRITVILKENGSPVYRAPISIKITQPGGSTKNRTVYTRRDGTYHWRTYVRGSDPLGNYAVEAQANIKENSVLAATTYSVLE